MEGRRSEVAVLDAAVAYRRGLAAALAAAGYDLAEPDDPVAWAKGPSAIAALVGVPTAERESTVSSLAGRVTVVALIPGTHPEPWWRAIQAGADAVVDRNADPKDIVAVLDHALHGRLLLPSEVVHWLAMRSPLPSGEAAGVGAEEAAWLRYLADGKTVAALADRVGFSERTMFRRLYEIYGRLGVRNRTEAIVAAQRLGLLGDGADGAAPADD